MIFKRGSLRPVRIFMWHLRNIQRTGNCNAECLLQWIRVNFKPKNEPILQTIKPFKTFEIQNISDIFYVLFIFIFLFSIYLTLAIKIYNQKYTVEIAFP